MGPASTFQPSALADAPEPTPRDDGAIEDPERTLQETLVLAHPLILQPAHGASYDAPDLPPLAGYDAPSQALHALADRYDADLHEEQRDKIRQLDRLPDETAQALATLVDAFLVLDTASKELVDAIEHSPDDPSPDARSLDLSATRAAQGEVLEAIQALEAARELGGHDACSVIWVPPAFSIDLADCDNTYTYDFALQIDAGGNDTYLNNAGGGQGQAATLIDLGPGDDQVGDPWRPRGEGANGGGMMGSGLLVNEQGNTSYHGGSDGVNGGGYLGAGILVDVAGDDSYHGDRRGINGGGHTSGHGVLVDASGDDAYVASEGAVNGGGDLGVGMLVDLQGEDTYHDQGTACTDCTQVPKDRTGARFDASDADAGMAEEVLETGQELLDQSGRYREDVEAVFGAAVNTLYALGFCIPHPPIQIQSDQGFRLPGSGVTNPYASGSAEDPYVIQGWCLQRLLLQGTSAHVLIRSNELSTGPGIELVQASNVNVQDNRILDGILLKRSPSGDPNVVVRENEIRAGSAWGVRVLGDGYEIARNNIHGNSAGGLHLAGEDNLAWGNEIHDNGGPGVLLKGTGNTLLSNFITDEEPGVRVESTGEIIRSNTFDDNEVGLYADEGGSLIEANSITSNRYGIELQTGGYELTRNTFSGNTWGLTLRGDGWDNVIRSNSFIGNHGSALQMDDLEDAVDVRHNWWNHATGPYSLSVEGEPFEDACTGELADGHGDEIDRTSFIGDPDTSQVCFDPWLTASP